MKYIPACQNCGSQSFSTWSASVVSGALHFSQCRCQRCGIVFSNPQSDASEIESYYGSHYYEEHWNHLLSSDSSSVEATLERLRPEMNRLLQHASEGRFLEVGAGTGAFMSLMRDAGFDVYGVEPSSVAVNYARERHGLTNVVHGHFEQVGYPSGHFDLAYAWHVIEHVVDLDRFVRELHRVLRPDGLLWIGTETYRNAGYYLLRGGAVIRGKVPPFATSSEHTFVFTASTLRDVLTRRGFRVISVDVYQPSWREKIQQMRFRHVFSRGYFALQHGLNSLCRSGPLLRVVARRV